jgi:hypothetical protein
MAGFTFGRELALAARVPDGKVPSRVLASNVDFRASCNLAFRLKFEKCALLPPPLRVSFFFPESPLSAFFCVKSPISMYRHISRYGRPVLKVEAMFMIGRRTAPRDLKQGNGCDSHQATEPVRNQESYLQLIVEHITCTRVFGHRRDRP